MLEEEFQGVVFPVNPKAAVVQSLKCYAGVEDIPDPVDLAVVVVPAPLVPDVARQCARKGVGGMIVDPFGGEIRDGRLFGRGACDTKGTMAAMLWALRELRDAIRDVIQPG